MEILFSSIAVSGLPGFTRARTMGGEPPSGITILDLMRYFGLNGF